MMRRCQECGAEVEKDDLYCPECGTKIKAKKGEARKITVWTVLKVIVYIIFFIIFINIFKNNPPIAIALFILFFIWTGIINKILKGLFNVELSLGVKVVITVILIVLFLIASIQYQTTSVVSTKIQPIREEGRIYEFVNELNWIIESKDINSLEVMLKKDMISHDVFEDVLKFMDNKEYEGASLQVIGRYSDEMFITVLVRIKSSYGEIEEETKWFFEKTAQDWRVYAIKPMLSEIEIPSSFEREVEFRLKNVKRPVIAVADINEVSAKSYAIKSNS